MLSALPGAMQLAQAAAERLDLLLIRVLLPLGQFQRLQHFLHIIECSPERLDDLGDLFDGVLNGRRGCGVPLPGWG